MAEICGKMVTSKANEHSQKGDGGIDKRYVITSVEDACGESQPPQSVSTTDSTHDSGSRAVHQKHGDKGRSPAASRREAYAAEMANQVVRQIEL